jgi:hypothetical protein
MSFHPILSIPSIPPTKRTKMCNNYTACRSESELCMWVCLCAWTKTAGWSVLPPPLVRSKQYPWKDWEQAKKLESRESKKRKQSPTFWWWKKISSSVPHPSHNPVHSLRLKPEACNVCTDRTGVYPTAGGMASLRDLFDAAGVCLSFWYKSW